MLELIRQLPSGVRVLDLGARAGSFRTDRSDLCIVRLDLDPPPARKSGCYVRADAARMPFASGVFDLIISNHSLEHFPELEVTVREMGRVMRAGGVLYIAVPDAWTLTDRIYRWMARGGGHVNAFRSPVEVVRLVEEFTGLPHRGTRVLYSSLSFLNAHHRTGRPQIKSALFAFGNERFLAVLLWALRGVDRRFRTRWSVYGWAFYFGDVVMPKGEAWSNVCVRCGSGHAVVFLRKVGAIGPLPGRFEWYRCPDCGGRNLLTRDQEP